MVVVVTIMVVMMVVVLMVVLMMVLVVVMMMVVVMMIPLMVGDGAIDGDGVGDDDDRSRGALKWRTRVQVSGNGCTPLYFGQISPKLAKNYIFQHWISPCLDTVSDRLVVSENSTSATV